MLAASNCNMYSDRHCYRACVDSAAALLCFAACCCTGLTEALLAALAPVTPAAVAARCCSALHAHTCQRYVCISMCSIIGGLMHSTKSSPSNHRCESKCQRRSDWHQCLVAQERQCQRRAWPAEQVSKPAAFFGICIFRDLMLCRHSASQVTGKQLVDHISRHMSYLRGGRI